MYIKLYVFQTCLKIIVMKIKDIETHLKQLEDVMIYQFTQIGFENVSIPSGENLQQLYTEIKLSV